MEPLTAEAVFEILADQERVRTAPFKGQRIASLNAAGHIFPEFVNFDGAVFAQQADFQNADFRSGASFLGAVFEHKAEFSYAQSRGLAYFWKACFQQEASFFRMTTGCEHPEKSRYPGESNFSYARFESNANFQRARFQGPTYFYRTIFRGKEVSFEEARFDDSAIFEGQENDICISEAELPDACLQYLKDKHYVVKCADNPGYYNFDVRIRSEKRLKENLEEKQQPKRRRFFVRGGKREAIRTPSVTTLSAEQITTVLQKWTECSQPMFATAANVSLQAMVLIRPDAVSFYRVDLSGCTFRNTHLDKVEFVDVNWDAASTFGLLGRLSTRRAVHDESQIDLNGELDSKTARRHYLDLREIYHDLRKNYEAKGILGEARDFYYGELEMDFLSKHPFRRLFSLTALYRVLSGYGTQEPLALLWLFFFVMVLFPALYLLFGSQNIQLALLRSLEIATFLKQPSSAPGIPEPSIAARFTEGIERLTVAVQASLFILATKAKFKE
ncbi:MAG: pentapeptide repeat-containing protein [Acidobacteriota bacterium]|nr:pentapeptide repeat-containing protein [Acidobacteriota bacterium]